MMIPFQNCKIGSKTSDKKNLLLKIEAFKHIYKNCFQNNHTHAYPHMLFIWVVDTALPIFLIAYYVIGGVMLSNFCSTYLSTMEITCQCLFFYVIRQVILGYLLPTAKNASLSDDTNDNIYLGKIQDWENVWMIKNA